MLVDKRYHAITSVLTTASSMNVHIVGTPFIKWWIGQAVVQTSATLILEIS